MSNSTKPYFIRALWQWCIDQGETPYLVVAVDEHTQVPAGYVKEGQITLNIGLDATNQLDIGNEFIAFQARFGGVAQQIFVPVERVAAIFSRESNEGMGFEVTDVVAVGAIAPQSEDMVPVTSNIRPVASTAEDAPDGFSDDEPPAPSGGGRPRFTVVK